MDKNLDSLENFEEKLKQHKAKKPSKLYSRSNDDNDLQCRSKMGFNPRDILRSISAQIKAIQNADCVKGRKHNNKELMKPKTTGLLSVNDLREPETPVIPQIMAAKFETQFVLDTQLMNVIEDVEAINAHKGITQEFETPFHNTNIEINPEPPDNKIESSLKDTNGSEKEKYNDDISKDINERTHVNKDRIVKSGQEYEFSNNKTSMDDNCTELFDKCVEIEDNVNLQDIITDSDIIPASPTINIHKENKFNITSPLVYNLDSFEQFERLALPIIKENDDMEIVKHLIKSQIIGNELFIHADFEPELEGTEERLSPVLKITKTPKIIKQDLAQASTSKIVNDCFDKSIKMTVKNQDHKEETVLNNKFDFIGSTLDNFTDTAITENINKKEIKSIDFEDEILFSSDEELDIKQTNLMDLPFTCALETSFYEHSDVLDTTMYVGFQTASNKSIQISTDSFSKAKSILDETDTVKVPTLKELVEQCDRNPKEVTIISGTSSANNAGCNRNVNSENDIGIKISTMFEGFKTANGKSIQISDKYMDKAKSLFNNIDEDVNNQSQNKKQFDGFKTASNKNIILSEQALKRCKRVFQDIDLEDKFHNEELPSEIKSCTKRIKQSLDNNKDFIKTPEYETDIPKIDEDILQEFEGEMSFNDKEFNENNLDNELIGFKTASNKNILISDTDNAKSKKIFDATNKNKSKSFCNSKKTASNKIINISEQAFAKTRNIFQDIELSETKNTSSSIETPKNSDVNKDIVQNHSIDKNRNHVTTEIGFVVFKTANNKMIAVSDDAIAKSKNIFRDIGDDETKNDKVVGNFDNKFIKNVDIFKPSTSKGFVRFQTANNKKISISEAAFEKTKNICQVLHSESNYTGDTVKMIEDKNISEEFDREFNITKDNQVNDNKCTNNVPTDTNKLSDLSEKVIEKSKVVVRDVLNEIEISRSDFKGFQTANNKLIPISANALEKSKKIFEDINKKNDETAFCGFRTASNKKVKISDEALAKSKKIFEDLDKNNDDPNEIGNGTKIPYYKGFQTASNKPVKVSAQALAKSKRIFEDLEKGYEDIEKDNTKSIIKDTASKNREVTNTNHILADTKKEFEDIGNRNELKDQVDYITSPVFKRFQTASNKEVKISVNALAKSRKIFENVGKDIENLDENDITPSPIFKGFQTANNKQVKVSESALAKSRKMFEDLDNITDYSNKNNDRNPGFKDLQSTSNKEVQLSPKALPRTKRIFENLEKFKEDFEKEKFMKNDFQISKEDSSKSDFNNVKKDVLATSDFVGFKTASKKKIEISAAAIEKTKKIFEVIDSCKDNDFVVEKNQTTFSGFQTASDKHVKISKEALAISKKLFKEYNQLEKYGGVEIVNEAGRNSEVITSLKGFQTASNREVKISAEALAKTKQVFKDINDFKENEYGSPDTAKVKGFKTANDKQVHISDDAINKSRQILSDIKGNERKNNLKVLKSFSFKSANNNLVNVSEEALLESKQIFAEFAQTEIPNSGIIKLKSDKTPYKKPKLDINIETLIDTQVINNFEESLNTEDFRSPENRSKRSGSPILSCPKAKRRKFETPYKKEFVHEVKKPPKKEIEVHDVSYKKNRKYTLKDIARLENDNNNITESDFKLNNVDLNNFKFDIKRNDITESELNLEQLKDIFLNAVNKKIVPDGWYENHVKLILWKLISYEIKFPKTMSGVCTSKNVLLQLKYRYFKELYRAERPALRRILEKDDVASKPLVLCVMDVFNQGSDSAANLTELLLTDGWYTVRATIDKMLAKYVADGRLKIGTKIVTVGAELLNCGQGVAPWEDTSAVRLKIFGNSTRRARWHARLGYHGNGAILSHLTAVTPEGGKIAALRVIVTRVYPPLYVEKFEDGSTVTRSERLEHIHQMKYEAERQAMVEKVYEELEKEMLDEESPDSDDVDLSKCSLDSGSQIARLLRISKVPSQFRANLTESQQRLLDTYTASKRDKLLQDIEDRVRSKLAVMTRNVVPLLKVRVAGVQNGRVDKALLSIWKPNEALSELITEGAVIEILNAIPTAVRYSELQLSAGRQTIFKLTNKKTDKLQPYIKSLTRTCCPIKDIITPIVTDYNEIDTVGIVMQIDPSHANFDTSNQFQNVYLTDEEKHIICINFWGGIKKFGFENILDTGQVVACVNLQKRAGNTRKSIPQYRATEFTYFTKTPKNVDARRLVEEMSKIFGRNRGFVEECVVVKNNLLKSNISNEIISPYRFQNHDISKNKIYTESPLARKPKMQDEFNLSGLDFDSTFRQTEPQELSPNSLLRKKRVQAKISKLKMYGEPPPLSPINIINKSKNATKSFKSPLLNTSVTSKLDTSVASEKKIPENMGENELNCSPVLGIKSINRTIKKGVNPVKLDFNSAIEKDESVDHFAEEFDASPPLSLD